MSEVESEVARANGFMADAISARSWCHVYTKPTAVNVEHSFGDHHGSGPVTRRVRGDRMRTRQGLYDEFGAAWQFGDYDGPSYGAFFRDSLLDMYLTWPTTSGFVVVITRADELLVDEPGWDRPYSPLRGLVDTFDNVVENYAEAEGREPDDPLDRPALSFDVILVTDAEHRDEVVRRWQAAGAPLED